MTGNYDQKCLTYTGWDIEFDTVIGRVGGKALLTIALLPSSILIARLLDKKDQNHVIAEFDRLERILKNNRKRQKGEGGNWWFFTTALTDRGSEMTDFKCLERSLFPIEGQCDEGLKRCEVYYCDAYSSWQKPHIEELHTLLRRVLPKKSWFDHLTQKEINLICSHINSYSRESLKGATPFQVAPSGFTDRLMYALGLQRIDADDVKLMPSLLDQ